ncbi:hypothetical protein SALBM311S_08252 [Streptomyces alboniger]
MAGGADTEVGVGPADQFQGGTGLRRGLVQGAEDVGVVELDGPHAGQAAEHTGRLGAVHAAQLGHTQREFAVAVGAGSVDEGVVGAEARTQYDLLRAQCHRREHVVAVVGPVARDLVQLPLAEDGRVHVPVPGGALRLPDVLLQGVPYDGPVGQPVRQPRAHQRVGVEQVEITAESSVVVHGGLSSRSPGPSTPHDEAPGHSPRGSETDSMISAPGQSPASSWKTGVLLGRAAWRDGSNGTAGGATEFRPGGGVLAAGQGAGSGPQARGRGPGGGQESGWSGPQATGQGPGGGQGPGARGQPPAPACRRPPAPAHTSASVPSPGRPGSLVERRRRWCRKRAYSVLDAPRRHR